MTALSDKKFETVRNLVESVPDSVVDSLQKALTLHVTDVALAPVRELVEAEARDRRLRTAVLYPVAALCTTDGRNRRRLTFPAQAMVHVWKGLAAWAPKLVAEAAEADATRGRFEPPPPIFDILTLRAAEGMRQLQHPEFKAAAALLDAARPDGAAQFIACLELSPVARQAMFRAPTWIARPGEDSTAAVRLAYKDAVAMSADAGPRFFEMLSAALKPRCLVLRLISAVMDRPSERFMAESEFAMFGEGLIADIDGMMGIVTGLRAEDGVEAGQRAGVKAVKITGLVHEIEAYVELSRDHVWGKNIGAQRKGLADNVERRLKETQKLVAAALPTLPGKLANQRRRLPRLSSPPDPAAVTRALTLLAFTREVRTSANYAGFGGPLAQLTEKLEDMLDHYVQDVIDAIRSGEADVDVCNGFLMVAADFNGLIRDNRAADLVRRRAAAAMKGDSPPLAETG